jgi:hypothetical protein
VEPFYYDDFFVSKDKKDAGEIVVVTLKGREVPIRFKRGISLGDKNAAKARSIVTRIKPDGKPEIVSIDDSAFALELLSRTIIEWPFKYRDGRPVPISKDTIEEMFEDCADELALLVMKRFTKKREVQQDFLDNSESI